MIIIKCVKFYSIFMDFSSTHMKAELSFEMSIKGYVLYWVLKMNFCITFNPKLQLWSGKSQFLVIYNSQSIVYNKRNLTRFCFEIYVWMEKGNEKKKSFNVEWGGEGWKFLNHFWCARVMESYSSSSSSEALFKQKPEERKAKRESKIGNKTNGRVGKLSWVESVTNVVKS